MGEPASELNAGLESAAASLAGVEGLPREANQGETLSRQSELQVNRTLLDFYPCGRIE